MTTNYVKGRLYRLKIADLLPNPNQARKFMDPVSLAELCASILIYGVLVPIQFCLNAQGALVIVSGHRRVKAAEMAGLTEIMGIFTDGDTHLQGFVENLQREGLSPVDEAEEMASLMEEYKLSQNQLADSLGKSQPSVSTTLTLNRLPPDVREACRTNMTVPKSFLLDCAKLKSEEAMRRKFEGYLARAAKEGQPAVRKPKPSKERTFITKTSDLAEELSVLPWSEWSEDDRYDLSNALRSLRARANELLNAMNGPPEEDEPDDPGDDRAV